MAALAKANSLSTLSLASNVNLKSCLRKFRKSSGILCTEKLCSETSAAVRNVLETTPCFLGQMEGQFPVVLDTGCTRTVTFDKADFVDGTLQDLPETKSLSGIGGGLPVTQEGIVRYEVLSPQGEVVQIETPAYHCPDLKIRLFSPQDFFRHSEGGELKVDYRGCIFKPKNSPEIPVDYHQSIFSPCSELLYQCHESG